MIWNVTQWHSYPSKRQINPPETPLGTYHGSIKINWIRHNWIHKCNILSKNNILRAFFFPGTRPLTMILTEVSICFSCIYKYHKNCSTVVKCSWCAVCQSVQIYYLLHCYTLYFMSFCFYLWWPRALDFLSFLDDVVGFTGDFIVWHNRKHDSHADTLRLLAIMILSHCRSACRHKNGSFKLATINISLAESNIQ